MLAQARQKCAIEQLRNVELILQDVESMDLNGKQFDVIICCEAIVLLGDPVGTLLAWKRHLKPGGTLAFTSTHETSYLAPSLQRALRSVVSEPPPHLHERLGTEARIRQALQTIGYEVLSCDFSRSGRGKQMDEVQCTRGFLGLMFQGHPTIEALSDEQMVKLRVAYREELQKASTGNAVWEDTSLFYVHAKRVDS